MGDRPGHHHHPAGSRTEPVHTSGDIDPRDFVSDEDFEKMMAGGKPVGAEDYGYDADARHQASHAAKHTFAPEFDAGMPAGPGHHPPASAPLHSNFVAGNLHPQRPNSTNPVLQPTAQRYDEPPIRQDHSPRPHGYPEAEGGLAEDDGDFSMPVATVLGQPIDSFGPSATTYGASGGYGNDAESYGQGYKEERPFHTRPHTYSHLPSMASTYDEHTDPVLFHQAAHKLHTDTPHPHLQHHHAGEASHHSTPPTSPPTRKPTALDAPMSSDTIGAAAAVQALKISAAQNQSEGAGAPAQAHPAQPPAPASVLKPPSAAHAAPAGAATAPDPEGAAAGGGPRDKIIALAMAQAAKLFDKHGGAGGSEAKVQAMHSAAATAMRLCGEYKTTGKLNLQPSQMQKLIGVAMSLL